MKRKVYHHNAKLSKQKVKAIIQTVLLLITIMLIKIGAGCQW